MHAEHVFGQVELDGRFEHRNFDRLTASAARDLVERRQDRVGNCLPGELVANNRGHIRGLAVHLREQACDAGAGLDEIVIGGLVRVRASGAESISTAVHDIGSHCAHALVVVAQASNRVGALIVYEDVCALDQSVERRPAFGALEVEDGLICTT